MWSAIPLRKTASTFDQSKASVCGTSTHATSAHSSDTATIQRILCVCEQEQSQLESGWEKREEERKSLKKKVKYRPKKEISSFQSTYFFFFLNGKNPLDSKKSTFLSFKLEDAMSEDAGRRKSSKKLEVEGNGGSETTKKASSEETATSPRTKDGTSAGRTRLGSTSKDKEGSSKADKEKSKSKDKDKESRNKHALSRTANRQNSIMPIPMPSPDKVEEAFVKLLVRPSFYTFITHYQRIGSLTHP